MNKHVVTPAYSKCGLCGEEFRCAEGSVNKNALSELLHHFKYQHNGQGFTCGRRAQDGMDDLNSPFVLAGKDIDTWYEHDGRDVCSYCGSISPEEFFRRVDEGHKVIPTDKSYKVYMQPDHAKFYFQHLTREAQQRFVDYLNDQLIKFDVPGYFYVRPFFIAPPPQGRPKED